MFIVLQPIRGEMKPARANRKPPRKISLITVGSSRYTKGLKSLKRILRLCTAVQRSRMWLVTTQHSRHNFWRSRFYNFDCTCKAVFNWVTKVIWNCFGFALLRTLCDWFKNLAPPTQPIRCKTNRHMVTRVNFPALDADYVYLLRVLIGSFCCCVCCDWPLQLLLFCFYDTQLETALIL